MPQIGRTHLFVSAVVGVCAMLLAAPSGAQPAPRDPPKQTPQSSDSRSKEDDQLARQLWLRGDRMYAQGKYEQALSSFESSYNLSGRARILVSMANAYERLGRYEEARDALKRYLPDARPNEADDLRERIRSLERRSQAQTDAEAVDASPAQEDAGAAGPFAPELRDNDPSSETATRSRPLGGWIVAGSGAALLAGGVGFAMVASSARDSAGESCQTSDDGATICLPDAESDFDRDRSFSRLADVSFAVGSAALVTGVVWLLLGGDDAAPSERPTVSVGPGRLEVQFVYHF